MAIRRPPLTKSSRSITGTGAKNSKGMFGGFRGAAIGIAGVAGVSAALSALGLPTPDQILTNPLYLGAAALGLFFLLK